MNFERTERFRRAYQSLPSSTRTRVDKTIDLLALNPRHPSLRLKKVQGETDIWEARVDRSHRMTLEIREGYYLLRNVGKHGETLGRP